MAIFLKRKYHSPKNALYQVQLACSVYYGKTYNCCRAVGIGALTTCILIGLSLSFSLSPVCGHDFDFVHACCKKWEHGFFS